ncbi:SLC13 family permease [Calditrichota bacterium LG25]|uniref:Di-and tricarboxylate transporter n=1 Tax=Caldithrix abyssi DSM 13497 TaxID=880073 RepID=H1XXJ0_CALAY|nr:SLC13 family permease [Caldithrix abyssi]APF19203.1 Di- and tricarboxylate transporter [Caldithrix abyssi DSM 13497]EHO43114.1 TrkA-C domain protein [Caldithrix abyssi DSM 13497]
MDFQFWYTLILLILTTYFLVKEIFETELTLLSFLFLLILGKVINVKEAFVGFSNEGMLTIGFLFIVAAGLSNSGLMGRLQNFLFGKSNHSGYRKKLMRILFPVTTVSAFINNTPVVALLIPTLKSWTERSNLSPSKFFIPLSYAAILGGMCTLIGTSTNLIIYGLMEESGIKGMEMFEISKIGVPVAISGLLFIVFVVSRFLPDRKEALIKLEENTREFVVALKVTPEYKGIGKTIEEAGLRHLAGLFLFQIERNGEIIAPARPDEVIRVGDRLFFTGLPKTILELQKTPGLKLIEDAALDLKQYDSSQIRPFEVVISNSSPLIGQNVRESNFRQKYDAVIIAIHRNGERIKKKIGDIVLKSGDTLLLLAHKSFLKKYYHSRDFLLVSESVKVPSKPLKNQIIAVGTIALMVTMFVLHLMPIVVAAGLSVMILLLTRTISLEEAREAVDFRVLVIIATAFGIAAGIKNSGVAQFFAHFIILGGSAFGIIGVLAGVFLVASSYTNIITNNAAAALVFPIVLAVTTEMQVDPRPFILTLAIAVSSSFATPISYQTNIMVYGPGGYRFKDFLRVGLPMQLFIMTISVALIYFYYF